MPKKGGNKKCGNQQGCSNPSCDNQNVMERGPGTRRQMSGFREGNGCPKYEPKSIGLVDMGEGAKIDIKIARTGVRGNRLRTDHCAQLLKAHLDQPILDRHVLQILRYA